MAQMLAQSMTDQLRLESLLEAVGDAARLLILAHNDPDPDAVASAAALKYVIETLTAAEVTIAYGGIVGRAENRALVHYLGVSLQSIETVDFSSFHRIALVDSQPGAGNNSLPPRRVADIVLDHHQPFRQQTDLASHADVRLDVGATSTILTGYALAAGLELFPRLATALFYGIKTDTMGLGRRAGSIDQAAYARLQPLIEVDELVAIERAQVPREYFQAFEQTLCAAEVVDGAVIAHLGEMSYPDMPAEMAEVLLRLEGTRWVMCSGFNRQTLFLSLRSTQAKPTAGQVAQTVVSGLGMAGGHGTTGGGQVPLEGQKRESLVREVQRRFLEVLGLQGIQPDKLINR